MSVSKQLIHLRNVKGISQEELASLMNVTRQAVSKRETDQTLPDSEKIIRLSEIFGVTTDYLLKGKETAQWIYTHSMIQRPELRCLRK